VGFGNRKVDKFQAENELSSANLKTSLCLGAKRMGQLSMRRFSRKETIHNL
jgi:hypothetical protein